MEQERRNDLLEDLRRRSVYNDMLARMAGQPVRGDMAAEEGQKKEYCSERMKELAEPKGLYAPEDITKVSSYRGLVHADYQLALETLHPGGGMQNAMQLRAEVSPMASPKNSPYETVDEELLRSQVKRNSTLDFEQKGRDQHMHKEVPVSVHRASQAVFRFSPAQTQPCTREQTLATTAPPAPNAHHLRGREDLPLGKPHDRDRRTLKVTTE